eukprot:Sspe_Gene.28789::Locus_13234_Transcript_1_1_Confidence_1.000_Length_2562::g.28789::m.28789
MMAVAEAAGDVDEWTEQANTKEAIVTNSKANNPGLEKLASGELSVENPTVGSAAFTIPYGSSLAAGSATSSCQVGVLGGAGTDGTVQSTEGVDVSATFALTSTADFEASVTNAKDQVVSDLSAKMLSKQEGIENDVDLLGEAGLVVYETPKLNDATPVTFACGESYNAGAYKPTFESVDAACSSGTRVVMAGSVSLDPSNFPDRVCGSTYLQVAWKGYDGCGQETEVKYQTVTFLPSARVVRDVPKRRDDHDGRLALVHGPGDADGVFGMRVGVRHLAYEDSEPEADSAVCGRWTIKRTWTISPWVGRVHGVDGGGGTRQQTITIDDVSAPEWTSTPEGAVSVPFFENYRSEAAVPTSAEGGDADLVGLGAHVVPDVAGGGGLGPGVRVDGRGGRRDVPGDGAGDLHADVDGGGRVREQPDARADGDGGAPPRGTHRDADVGRVGAAVGLRGGGGAARGRVPRGEGRVRGGEGVRQPGRGGDVGGGGRVRERGVGVGRVPVAGDPRSDGECGGDLRAAVLRGVPRGRGAVHQPVALPRGGRRDGRPAGGGVLRDA